MAMPEKISVDKILRLVDQLTPAELLELQRTLDDKTWGQQFHQLCDEIEATRIAKGLPRITEEEIAAEVKAVREEKKIERAHKSRN
jgi:hypothetical protein